MKPTLLLAAGLGCLVTCLPAQAELKFSGYVEGELRLYPADGILKEQKEAMGSLAVEPELAWKSEDENHRLRFKPFARYSDSDGHRDHADIRELFYTYSGEGWQVTAGIDKVYWGVVESLHAVDIINQTDVVESVNGEQKLGQPMITFGVEQAWGNLDLYLLPWFRERRFPEGPERFRLSLNGQPIKYDKNSPLFDSHNEEKHIDSAVRWKKSFGTLDLALSYFNGTHREAIPVLVDVTVINPVGPIIDTTMGGYYEQMEQSGIELQYLYDSWAFKLEGSYRNLDSGRYTTIVSGFEYTLSDLQPWGADLGILVEYLWNNRQEVDIFPLSLEALPAGDKALLGMLTPAQLAALRQGAIIEGEYLSPMQNDIFLGTRFGLNDIGSTEFLAGVIVDADNQTTSGSFEGSTRIGDDIRISLNIYLFEHVDENSAFYSLRRDDQVEMRVAWYF